LVALSDRAAGVSPERVDGDADPADQSLAVRPDVSDRRLRFLTPTVSTANTTASM